MTGQTELIRGPFFLKGPETFQACKAIFSSLVSKNGELYSSETSCMKGTSLHITNRICEQNSSVIVRFEILIGLYGLKKFPGL